MNTSDRTRCSRDRHVDLDRRQFLWTAAGSAAGLGLMALPGAGLLAAPNGPPGAAASSARRPNIILAMTDDQGWGDVGYNGHPALKTPVLDEMAASGIRFNRFYAAAPVCSPTRGSCLTGRHPNRFGCFTHGKPIRRQEMTVARALKQAGYATGHFGKWHLNGVSGAGRPISADDPLNPGAMGFDRWVSATNFFDLDPSLGRNGESVRFAGDGSDITVDEALKFIRDCVATDKPFLAVIWFGNPHSPHKALDQDRAVYADQPARLQNYYGELTGVDRAMGRLRKELRTLGVADDTMLWFCSDNGPIGPGSAGGLRGGKGTLWEGGVRVPGLLEWPARVRKPFATDLPCSTSDYLPTIVELLGLKVAGAVEPIDGVSLATLIGGKPGKRARPIPFWVWPSAGGQQLAGHAALTDTRYKLHRIQRGADGPPALQLYDIVADARETTDLAEKEPRLVADLNARLENWQRSVLRSLGGEDYPAP